MAKRPAKKDVTEVPTGGVPPFDLPPDPEGPREPPLPDPPTVLQTDPEPEQVTELELAPQEYPQVSFEEAPLVRYPDPQMREWHQLIYQLETAVSRGHASPVDKELMMYAAALIRILLGLEPTELLIYPDPPAYGPVANAPPIGHSLK